MTKIYIDYEDLRVNNNLKEACNYLRSAKDVYLNIPRDFNKSSKVRGIVADLNNAYIELNKVLNWLESSQKDYSNLDMEALREVSRIEVVEVKSNSSIVK